MERLTCLRPAGQRTTDFKKKGSGIDKRSLRLHRRSIDQRKMRDAALVKHRGIDNLSPLKEVQNVVADTVEVKNVATKTKKSVKKPSGQPQDELRNRLKKWKEEKELKKKLEREKKAKRPAFKVRHIEYEKTPLDVNSKEQPATTTTCTSTKPSTSSRVTRSMSRKTTQAKPTVKATRATRSRNTSSNNKKQEHPVATRSRALRSSRNDTKEHKVATKNASTRVSRSTRKNSSQESQTSADSASDQETPAVVNEGKDVFRFGNRPEETAKISGDSTSADSASDPETPADVGEGKDVFHFGNFPQETAKISEGVVIDQETPAVVNEGNDIFCFRLPETSKINTDVRKESTVVDIPCFSNLTQETAKFADVVKDQEMPAVVNEEKDVPCPHNLSEEPAKISTEAIKDQETPAAVDKGKDETYVHNLPEETAKVSAEAVKDPETPAVVDDDKMDVPCPHNQPEETAKFSEDGAKDPERPVAVDGEKDVPYFRNLVTDETNRLNGLCSKWHEIMDSTQLSEEVCGEIRCTTGKAQLLIVQRFKQFSGLVDNCEFNRGEKKTHCSDLIGFWEMVYYQVEDVDKMFADLDKLQANNWQREKPAVKVNKKPKKAVTKKPTDSAASKKRAADRQAARQRLMAAKAAMKTKATRSKDSEKVVFDAGFFKVESPVKQSPKVHAHCEAGSPLSAKFFRRTSSTPNKPNSRPGSRQGTPRQALTPTKPNSRPGSRQGTPRQAFIPSNPMLSNLCTPISKLALTDSAPSPVNKVASKRSSPSRKSDDIRMEDIPSPEGPSSKVVIRESVAHPLIPGIASPHLSNDSNRSDGLCIFTPPRPSTQTTSSETELISFDSPIPSSLAPPLPLPSNSTTTTESPMRLLAVNADIKMDLLMASPVRRSPRLRSASGQTGKAIVDKLTETSEFRPNMSLI